MNKPQLGFWQIWNMSFGFLGIQAGLALQTANMSPIYKYLGAEESDIPILWLAAPLTGLIMQPLIGHMSDRTWCRLGRRRPYFLVGALLASVALILMPNSSSLWMAAGLLWILDASINISMEPFRAFVADLLPERQRTKGFAMQSLFIGFGAVVASGLPYFLAKAGIGGDAADAGEGIPMTVKISFYIGSAAFLGAVLWTILTTKEYPPQDLEAYYREKQETAGFKKAIAQILGSLADMPGVMRRLALVQLFTWLGLFCMWLYFAIAIAESVFHTTDAESPLFKEATEWGGVCFAMYNGVCFVFSFALLAISGRFGPKATHAVCLVAGALGLMSVPLIDSPNMLLLSMTGVGIAWASILSMPYAILAGVLPESKMGTYMGIFNFFIVIPQICAAVVLGPIMKQLRGNEFVVELFGTNAMLAIVAGGFFMLLAALLMTRVQHSHK